MTIFEATVIEAETSLLLLRASLPGQPPQSAPPQGCLLEARPSKERETTGVPVKNKAAVKSEQLLGQKIGKPGLKKT